MLIVCKVIQSWNEEGGVLLIGYELYRQLSLKKPPKSRNRSKRKTEAEEDLEDEKCKNMLECEFDVFFFYKIIDYSSPQKKIQNNLYALFH